jgi:hypothetical protein
LFSFLAFAQIEFQYSPSPRLGKYGDSAGNYEVVSRFSSSTIIPGGNIDLDVFITGYGQIGNSKLFFEISASILDSL